MKRVVIIGLVMLASVVKGQVIEELVFKEDAHDFGLIKEVDGPAEFQFDFTNTGENPVTITNVRASCGCTTPNWSHEPILPGKTGFIKAVYNPRNRPGPFHKTLTVSTTGKVSTVVLSIQGTVEPKPLTLEDEYPVVIGGLRVKYRAFNMGKVYTNRPATKDFSIYNQSDKPIRFEPRVEGPPYISARFEPEEVGPMQSAKIFITYDGKAKNDLGFMSDNIVIHTNDSAGDPNKIFSVYADVNQYFGPLSAEDAAKAPRLVIEQSIFDFGSVEEGSTAKTTFVLKNNGRSDLVISKTQESCDCMITNLTKNSLKPSESVEMEVSFNSTGRRGNQQKSVTIYTNDPISPVQRVSIKALVNVAQKNN